MLVFAALIAAWQAWTDLGSISEHALPSPSRIIQASLAAWPDLMEATQPTATEGFIGFLLATGLGVLAGIGLYRWRSVHDALYPLIAAAQMVPLITVAPLFIIWFGFEPLGKVVIVALFALFPIAVQTYRGLQEVPPFYQDVALTCGASQAWTLWHVKLRVAARQIFSGLRVSAAYVFATAATAEYLGARNGLGIWLQSAFNSFQTPLIFSATLVIMALTGILLGLIALAERALIGGDDQADSARPED
ncbi:Permease protein of ABC transporter system [Bifidobacterium actinocoloniiforme DSM 22766]|uniref:Permease protein of ABC transporter system n=1 Tax=Bifidobacterium actinocoloniiforme DSM 22766 TaxID=1437605 RepID=A0A086Z1W2_9BIFI|nr:ABC transporter permease [Bifidobacterium actinocoloniiforme]AKV55611.1 ABC transporter permease [Bifidobacterium actinocoloniiforme DSM 22766]KFI40512.1 Permease protein of ABC transporter system [Bifidobacterium actinocoloniiforme DSM 22766]